MMRKVEARRASFVARVRAQLCCRRGAVAVYASLVLTLLSAFGAIGIDYGRLVALRAQLQSAADAAAIAAARQLDGTAGARDRASAVAANAAQNSSLLVAGSFQVANVAFFSALAPDVAAVNDADASSARVTLAPESLRLLLQPVLNVIASSSASSVVDLTASAGAAAAPLVCNAPPLMICDPSELLGSSGDLRDPANAGRQVNVLAASSSAPGNFGLLCPSDANCGASAIEEALAAVEPGTCRGNDVTTAPGNRTGPVADGINNRFDQAAKGKSAPVKPAPNVVSYPRDTNLATVIIGDGTWNPASYWAANHPGTSLPAVLAQASRYQVYLYEVGVPYAAKGKQTIAPPPAVLPPGFSVVSPPRSDVPVAGRPKNSPVGFERRTLSVAILSCLADDVRGKGTYPTRGRYVDIFLTEPDPGGSGKVIIGEIIGNTANTGNPNYHANVKLAQ